MAKLIILRGLPASGKSTWARSWCEDPANTWPHCVISLDDIRLMIAGSAQVRNRLQSEHGKRFNDMVVAMGRHMIADALDAGWDVVADAQHANPRYAACLCSISCCGFSHDDFSGLGRACRPRNGLNWMVLVSPPERTGKDYDQHAPSTVYPSFAAERGIRRVDRAENTCQRADGA